ncbi:MAG: RNase adapter RapZ [Rhodospirillaceae bacterium]|nr:RNase adapter RapZ [Rhodospirillaceae bacterium]|tara:strand:+ start:6096 stop:6947 length:852 start_codon:yes stop_codon:yes gene_type:complete
MRIVIISGLSGSGKSVALHVLEDLGFYCIDNIPVRLLSSFVSEISPDKNPSYASVGVGLDARNMHDIKLLREEIKKLRNTGATCEVIFLQAKNDILLSRFSETRRKHPLTFKNMDLNEAVSKERELLGPIIDIADLIVDTTKSNINELRELIENRIKSRKEGNLSILVQSFGYKHGLPPEADFVFDVRCLPNPYWEKNLRPLNGLNEKVINFLNKQSSVSCMIEDITKFLNDWIPCYQDFQRAYLTIAIGCTGGQHRSVHIVENVAKKIATETEIQIIHRELN